MARLRWLIAWLTLSPVALAVPPTPTTVPTLVVPPPAPTLVVPPPAPTLVAPPPAPTLVAPPPAPTLVVPSEEQNLEEIENEGDPQGEAATLWPTAVPLGDAISPGPLRLPDEKERTLLNQARALDLVLAEAAQDLGLLLDVGARPPPFPRSFRDSDLLEEAQTRNGWLISPRIERDGSDWRIKIIAIPPGSTVLLIREERVPANRLSVRGVVMLRDILRFRGKTLTTPLPPQDDSKSPRTTSRTSGRGVLTATLTLFGGYTGYALHTSSRGHDPRLLYPLMALGTGIGLGAATIVAEEWNLTLGDAWFLTAGATWPTASALLLARGYNSTPSTDAHAFALVSGIAGVGLSTIALARHELSEGSALLTHSGGLLGGGLGALIEMTVQGSTQETPLRGTGFGTAGGWLLGGTLGTLLKPSTRQILFMDLGAGLGALGGAALASPLLLENPSKNQERLWLGAAMSGSILGAGLGLWLSKPSETPTKSARLLPTPGVVAASRGADGSLYPVMGLTWSGLW